MYHKAQAMIRNNEGAGDDKVRAIQEDPVVAVDMYRAAVLNTSSEEPHHTMGEVLTSDDVLQRLEESKISKKIPKTPKPSTSKKQKI